MFQFETLKKKNILVIDKNPVIRKGIRHVLYEEEESIGFFEAENGKDALSILKSNVIDLIVLDDYFNSSDSVFFLKQRDPIHRLIPIIMLSKNKSDLNSMVAFTEGVMSVFEKRTTDIYAFRSVVFNMLELNNLIL